MAHLHRGSTQKRADIFTCTRDCVEIILRRLNVLWPQPKLKAKNLIINQTTNERGQNPVRRILSIAVRLHKINKIFQENIRNTKIISQFFKYWPSI